ncbi:DUF7518 family protein [Halobacterium zhouii]|uniref:DUF7518 family protein n=1 Tax=Halobacterium zhouii TaxID=2902624 RepID=UPI001E58A62D|nr:hypothetical protein [Halobacterium zhouii]
MTEDSSRADDLEERVSELEATVRGLTEELVDAGERIRTLEEELDRSPSTEELREARETASIDPDETEDEAPKSAEGEDSSDTEESDLDDIIVA